MGKVLCNHWYWTTKRYLTVMQSIANSISILELPRVTGNTIHEGIITIPWEYEGFAERFSISDFEAWTLEKIPSVKMSYELPSRYLTDRADEWKTDIITAPPCGETISLLSMVKTARNHWIERQLIRKFYELTEKSGATLRFILGLGKADEDPVVSRNITEEIQKFNDIVIGNFTDEYDNLPLKTLTGHEYVNEKCQQNDNRYVIFHDDDTLPIFDKLKLFLGQNKTDVACFAHKGEFSRPLRWNKYNVTFEQWEAGHYYPEFCGGPCAGFTQKGEDSRTISEQDHFK